MATPEETMFEQVQEAISKGDKARARDLLTRLLRSDANNIEYWLCMSSVVETVKERMYCLKEVLRIDPENQVARKGLILIGALPRDESLVIPPRFFKRNWENQILGAAPSEKPPVISRTVFIVGGALLLLVVATVLVLIALRGPETVTVRPPTVIIPEATSTTLPTPSPVVRTPTPTFVGPTPLSIVLNVTYTVTPIYVKTEHPSVESFRSGISAYERGDWNLVIQFMEQVVTPEPSAADAYFYIGEAHRFKGEFSQAREAYEKAQEVNPAFAPAYYGQALLLMRNPEALVEAEELLKKAVQLDPQYIEAYLQLAGVQLADERPQDALDTLDQAKPAMRWEMPLWYLYHAQADILLNEPAAALENALKANKLDVTMLEAYKVIGQAYQMNGDLPSSVGPLEIYRQYFPDDTDAANRLARAYRADGKNEQAVDLLSQLLKKDRRAYTLYMERGWAYLALGKPALARDDFASYIGYQPKSLEAHIGLGRSYLDLKLYANAWEQFYLGQPYVTTDAEQAEIYYWESLALEGKEDLAGAINMWYEMLKLPADVIPDEWEEYARQRLTELNKKVPTPVVLQTGTPTPTPTPTRQLGAVTRTPTPTASRTPTPVKTP